VRPITVLCDSAHGLEHVGGFVRSSKLLAMIRNKFLPSVSAGSQIFLEKPASEFEKIAASRK